MKDKFKKILEDKELENKREHEKIMKDGVEIRRQMDNFNKNQKSIFKICFKEIENVVNDFELSTL